LFASSQRWTAMSAVSLLLFFSAVAPLCSSLRREGITAEAVYKAVPALVTVCGLARPRKIPLCRDHTLASHRAEWLWGWFAAGGLIQAAAPTVQVAVRTVVMSHEKTDTTGIWMFYTLGFAAVRSWLAPLALLVGPFFSETTVVSYAVSIRFASRITTLVFMPFALGDRMISGLGYVLGFLTGCWLSLVRCLVSALGMHWLDRRMENAPATIRRRVDKFWTAMLDWALGWAFRRLRRWDTSLAVLKIRPHEWANVMLSLVVAVSITVEQRCTHTTAGLSFWKFTHHTWTDCESQVVGFEDLSFSIAWVGGWTLLRWLTERMILKASW